MQRQINMIAIAAVLALSTLNTEAGIARSEDIDPRIQNTILDATLKVMIKRTDGSTLSAGSGTVIYNGPHTGDLGVTRRIVVATAAHVISQVTDSGLDSNGELRPGSLAVIELTSYLRDQSGQVRGSKIFRLDRNFEILETRISVASAVDAAFLIIDLAPTSRWLKTIPAVEMAGTIKASRLRIGSDVLVAGSPLVMDPIIFRNRLVQRNVHNLSFQHVDFLGHLVSRVFTPGNSGGGVYDKEGRFIGVVTLRIGDDFGAFTGIDHILPEVIGDRDVLLLLNP